jgi:NDP-sugar pyrophosphorylase family protein
MRAVLVATGDAAALAPLTEREPVPLLPLVDRPLVQHVVESLVARGVRHIDFILSHLPEKLEAFLGDGRRWGCRFTFHLTRDPRRPYRLLKVLDLRNAPILLGHADRLTSLPEEILTGHSSAALLWRESTSGETSRRHWAGWARLTPEAVAAIPGDPDEETLAAHLFHSLPDDVWLEVPSPIPLQTFPEYFAAHEAVLSKKSPTPLTLGRETEPGIWLGRNVSIHPTARVQAPVYIGDNSAIGPAVALGPYAVVGGNCMLDAGCSVSHSVVFPGSYVGEHLELASVVVDRNTLVHPHFNEAVTIADPLLLGSLPELGVVPPLQALLSRVVAATLLVLALPVLLVTALYLKVRRSGPVCFRRRMVRLPAPATSRTRTFDMWSFKADGNGAPCSWCGLLLHFLPGLINIARGELSFVGLPPRSENEMEALPTEWQSLYRRSKAGLIGDWSFLIGAAMTVEERYAGEAYYTWAADWRYDVRVLAKYFLRVLAGPLSRHCNLAELRADLRHFTHLIALSPEGDRKEKQLAVVRDISRSGCGVEATQLYPNGTRLTVSLHNPRRHSTLMRVLVVRHATEMANGKALLGCQFQRALSEEELQELR